MTEWITRPERHVPDEELHAYFDQALSRSQCAEIETHLSHCAQCQAQRALVAALRDQTTALLARLAPYPVITPPPFQVLLERRSRQLQFAMWRARFKRAGLWAAGIAAATGIGWVARTALDPHRTLPSAPIAEASAPVKKPAPQVVAVEPQDSAVDLEHALPAPIAEPEPDPAPTVRRNSGPSATPPSIRLASALSELGTVTREAAPPPETRAETGGPDPFRRIWRVVQWEDALRLAGSGLPFIEGMPVVGVLLRPGSRGERPTVIVAQQDAYGEVIQSIEGPVERVEDILKRQPADVHVSETTRTAPDYVDEPGGGVRRTLRILAIAGRLSVDSLNALARLATIR